MDSTMASNAGTFVSRLFAWTKAPFTAPVSLSDFMLLVVLGITVAIAWTRVLGHIVEE